MSLDNNDERLYWRSRTPVERLRHVQYLRRLNYGPRATEPMERVMEIVPMPWARKDDRQP
ncbi:MAG TPA: hypothetical protein VF665_21285 [Longimicrobium sp.]